MQNDVVHEAPVPQEEGAEDHLLVTNHLSAAKPIPRIQRTALGPIGAVVIMLHLALTAATAVLGGIEAHVAAGRSDNSAAIGLALIVVGFLSHMTSWTVLQIHMKAAISG